MIYECVIKYRGREFIGHSRLCKEHASQLAFDDLHRFYNLPNSDDMEITNNAFQEGFVLD